MSIYAIIGYSSVAKLNNLLKPDLFLMGNRNYHLIFEMILRYLPDFGGVNFERYKLIEEGARKNFFIIDNGMNPIELFIKLDLILSLEKLTGEDYNRIVAAFLKGKKEYSDAVKTPSKFKALDKIYPGYNPSERQPQYIEFLNEAETKFKVDWRYNPKWVFDSKLKNDSEVVVDCTTGCELA